VEVRIFPSTFATWSTGFWEVDSDAGALISIGDRFRKPFEGTKTGAARERAGCANYQQRSSTNDRTAGKHRHSCGDTAVLER